MIHLAVLPIGVTFWAVKFIAIATFPLKLGLAELNEAA